MAESRPFPPSPRRSALARRAGLHAASPLLGGAIVGVAIVIALAALGRSASALVGSWMVAAARQTPGALAPAELVRGVLELVLPLLLVAALACVGAHLAQVRTLWLPRRSIKGAPAVDGGGGPRTRRAAFELGAAAVIGIVAFGWLWGFAPRLAALADVPLAGGYAIASALAAFAIAWVALGVLDAIARQVAVDRALHMTAAEKREDDRLAAPDPRWARRRRELMRGADAGPALQLLRDDPAALAEATLIVLGDDRAIAIAWDPTRRPIPARIATARDSGVTTLLGLARRYAIPVQRDAALARQLSRRGPVSSSDWPRLAEIVAALRR